MNKLILSFLSLSTLLFDASLFGQQEWGKKTISDYTNEAFDIEVDNSGNYYIAGYITGETAFGQSATTPASAGTGDVYIAKYASSGNFLWVKTFGGSFSDRASDLAIGPDQQVVMTGQFFGTVNFGSTVLTSSGNSKDIFLAKLSASGDVLWAVREGGNMAENAYGVTVDHSNNVILTGQFQGASSIAGQTFTSANDPVTGLPSFDLFISKYTSSGNALWVRSGNAKYEDRGLAVSVDSQDNIFMTGQYSDTLIFASQNFNNSAYNVGFLAKLNPSGQLVFLNNLRAGMVVPNDLEVNSLNEVVVTGDYRGTLNYYDANGPHSVQNSYDEKVFVLKTLNNGNFSWLKAVGSDNFVSGKSVSCDPSNSIYIIGDFKCGFSQLRENNAAIFNSAGFKDPYIMKFSSSGNSLFARQLGGQWQDEGYGVAVRENDQPVLCGSYSLNLYVPADPSQAYFSNDGFGYDSWSVSNVYTLSGDSTRNSFIVYGLGEDNYDYNYYGEGITDSLIGDIGPDTIVQCGIAGFAYNPLSHPNIGPTFDFLWNDGATSQENQTYTGGWFNVEVTRHDECAFDRDSVFVIINDIPQLPLMTDNLGIAVDAPGDIYAQYFFCGPSSVTTWFSALQPGESILITEPDGTTHNSTAPVSYSDTSVYNVFVQNENCSIQGYFSIDYPEEIDYDTLQPEILLYQPENADTITICYGDIVSYRVIDLDDGSGNIDSIPYFPLYDWNWDISLSESEITVSDSYLLMFKPHETGYYRIDYTAISGMDNGCEIDTLSLNSVDSVYIIVNPEPQGTVEITGENEICPDGSTVLTAVVSGNVPGNWSGLFVSPGDLNTFQATVTIEGEYYYTVVFTDPVTGCTNSETDWHSIEIKSLEDLVVNPSDLVICPNSTATISAEPGYANYEWIGPDGIINDSDNSIEIEETGVYYCHVLDEGGCQLTAPPVVLNEFSTPYVIYEPSLVICENENITLTAVFSGDATLHWLSPLNSSANSIQVDEPGTYVCEIEQCGITTSESITIIDGSFEIEIASADTLLCFNESIAVTAPSGFTSYEWSNSAGGPVATISEPGIYSVTVVNQNGCSATSNSIEFFAVEGSTLPEVEDVTVCAGSDVTLTDNGDFTTHWYTFSDSTEISSGNTLILNNVSSDTIILAAYPNTVCPLVFDLVNILVSDSLTDLSISGDAVLCPGETATFSIEPSGYTVSWTINGQNAGTENEIVVDQSLYGNSILLSATVSNSCYDAETSETIITVQPETIGILEDSLVICANATEEISVSGNIDSLIWTGSFGSSNEESLIVTSATGNGWIYVSATDLNGCQTNTESVYLTTSALAWNVNNSIANSCSGDSVTFEVTTSTDSLQWLTPNGIADTTSLSFVINASTDGYYILQLWDVIGCVYNDTFVVADNPLPVFNLPSDTILCLDDLLSSGLPENENTYTWLPSGEDNEIPVTGSQTTVLIATSPEGCTFSDTIYIQAVDCEDATPNIITPNNDGVNDFLYIDEAATENCGELTIFDRFGNVVYNSTPYLNNFNGSDLDDGVYFYIYHHCNNGTGGETEQQVLHVIR